MRIQIRYYHWVPRILGIGAITLYPYILISSRSIVTPSALLKHEMEHVHQVRRDGWFRFYARYLAEYFKNLLLYRSHNKAYFNISYEVEARAAESMSLTAAEKDEVGGAS
jgi:hypothetical protein